MHFFYWRDTTFAGMIKENKLAPIRPAIILFLVTMSSYFLSLRGLRSTNPNAVVRSVYGSFMIKFFACAIAAFIYIMTAKKNVNKPALFICMGLYIVYSFIEVSILTKLSKQKKNA